MAQIPANVQIAALAVADLEDRPNVAGIDWFRQSWTYLDGYAEDRAGYDIPLLSAEVKDGDYVLLIADSHPLLCRAMVIENGDLLIQAV
jgi:hypothetical protein